MASIYKRGKIWWIQYSLSGKRFLKSLKTKEKTSALYLKKKIEIDLEESLSPIPQVNIPINKALDKYIEHCKHRVSEYTYKNYMMYLKQFIDYESIRKVKDINERKLSAFVEYRLNKGISKNTVNHIITYVKSFLNFCVKQNYLSANPLINYKEFKLDKKPPRFLTKSEIKEVSEIVKDVPFHLSFIFAVYTGMRKSELFRLTMDDIDLKNNTITVQKAKSKKFRVIPLHPKLKKEVIQYDGINLQTDISSLHRRSEKYRWVGWHTARHTFASHLTMSGVDLSTVSKLLGHADIKTTQIYAHLSQDHINESVKKLKF